jgi:hypothetical protein
MGLAEVEYFDEAEALVWTVESETEAVVGEGDDDGREEGMGL